MMQMLYFAYKSFLYILIYMFVLQRILKLTEYLEQSLTKIYYMLVLSYQKTQKYQFC